MKEYYNDPKATAEVFDKDGFLKTGDIGYYDDDLCFYIMDRIKETFKYRSSYVSEKENTSHI